MVGVMVSSTCTAAGEMEGLHENGVETQNEIYKVIIIKVTFAII